MAGQLELNFKKKLIFFRNFLQIREFRCDLLINLIVFSISPVNGRRAPEEARDHIHLHSSSSLICIVFLFHLHFHFIPTFQFLI